MPLVGGRFKRHYWGQYFLSKGDKAEPFGGLGESWKGAFVAGGLLVEAVTNSAKPIKGNFGETILLPENV